MARKSPSKPAPRPFDSLSRQERAAWRALPATRAFRAHLAVIKAETVEALLAAAEKHEGAPALAGMVRALERVDREILSDPEDARVAPPEEIFIDPADPAADERPQ